MKYAIFLILLSYTFNANADTVPTLAELEIEMDTHQTLPLSDKISFEFVSNNTQAVAKNLHNFKGININQVHEKSLHISMTAPTQYTGEVIEKYYQNSFVIDLNEKSTKDFVAAFKQEYKPPFDREKLISYVNSYIDNPVYIHGFNVASIIANQRSGDCTEYAVLVTALARSLGLPARLVLGTVIIEGTDRVTAYGHAWAEVWQNAQWHIADAALYKSEAVQHFYLPSKELENEGPGYTLSIIDSLSLMPMIIRRLRSL